MPGLLDQATQPQASPSSPMMDVQQAQMDTAAKMDKLKRLVLAGKKILYTKPASDQFLQYLDKDNLPESIGAIVSLLMAALIDKGREQAAPPDLIIPAGVTLVGELLSYASEVYDIEADEALAKECVMAFVKTFGDSVAEVSGGGQPAAQPIQPTAGGMQ